MTTISVTSLLSQVIPTFVWGQQGRVLGPFFIVRLTRPNFQDFGRNLEFVFRVPMITLLLFMKDTVGDVMYQLMLADGTLSLMEIRVMAHTFMHCLRNTRATVFTAGSSFKPIIDGQR